MVHDLKTLQHITLTKTREQNTVLRRIMEDSNYGGGERNLSF